MTDSRDSRLSVGWGWSLRESDIIGFQRDARALLKVAPGTILPP
jgi:hypothetical protein